MRVTAARVVAACAFTLAIAPFMGARADAACARNTVGLNKFDLALQYGGRASGGDGSSQSTRITRAMAQRAIKDAMLIHTPYFRLAAMGYAPVESGTLGDLALWVEHPGDYWSAMDRMFADLNTADICVIPVFLWNRMQIPAIAGEPFHELIANPGSASWRLLQKYVSEFVIRYRANRALLFYELTNELNLSVDLDNETRCRKAARGERQCRLESNFTTREMNEFIGRFSALIRRLDGSHQISSGYSMPAASAHHLSQRPEWTKPGADWTPDSAPELAAYLGDIHRSVDIISVHLYASNSQRLGLTAGNESKIVDIVQSMADKIGKPLFVGEFGQSNVRGVQKDSFIEEMISALVKARVMYSAVWVWEFYQFSTDSPYATAASSYSLEPGYSDALIAAVGRTNARRSSQADGEGVSNAREFPRVILTKPLECEQAGVGTRLFAVATNDDGLPPTVIFYLDGTQIARVAAPPYTASLASLGNLAGDTAEVEARTCEASGECHSFKTTVFIREGRHNEKDCREAPVAAPG